MTTTNISLGVEVSTPNI